MTDQAPTRHGRDRQDGAAGAGQWTGHAHRDRRAGRCSSVFANGRQHASRATSKCASIRRGSSVVSIHHFINLGGAEFVVLRATPEDVEAGVQVGDARYPLLSGHRRSA